MNLQLAVDQASTFTDLLRIAQKINPEKDLHITFWGLKYITLPSYEGTLGIDDLAARVGKLLWKNREFEESERKPGKLLTKQIDLIYTKSDQLHSGRNIFTRIVCILRDFFHDQRIRFQWEGTDYHQIYGGDNWEFFYYTEKQFVKKFGFHPSEQKIDPHINTLQRSNPDRWLEPHWAKDD